MTAEKHTVRDRTWSRLEQQRAAPPGVHGHIPAFTGADRAAARLSELPEWQARVVRSVPDTAQTPVRALALRDGKLLYMAVPKLAAAKPFYLLDPAALPVEPEQAATKDTAARVARPTTIDQMRPVDLIVCGSVAVNEHGARLGKGAGYSDIEVALLQEAGLIHPTTTIVTTVHDLQVVDHDLPEAGHDFRVDIIVTPSRVIRCDPHRRPSGIVWDQLSDQKIAAIPVLNARKPTPPHRSQ